MVQIKESSPPPRQVLVVDDSETVRREIAQSLKHAGFIPLEAGDGVAGLKLAQEQKPALIILDVNMPGLTGFDVLEHVRKSETHEKLPIIMFTTSNDQVIIETSLRLGANYFVQKSGNFPNLKKSIEHALKIDWSKFKTTSDNFVYAA